MAFGTMFSLSSRHWLGVWAGLEINLIGFLPILVYQKSMLERESAVKYFIIQALGSSLLIFGRLMGYRLSLSWESLVGEFFQLTGTPLLSFGLLLKRGIFPFHFWLPRVMAGLSWLPCLLLATWQKMAPILLILSLVQVTHAPILIFILCFLGARSRIVGGFGGLNQTQVRALLAYSSIGHIGWVLFGICSSETSVKVYFSIYVLISVCLFSSLWILDSKILKRLRSIRSKKWRGAFSFSLILLSLGGLPPLLGFVSKWVVITSGTLTSSWGFLLALILGSLISLFYYLRLFFSELLTTKRETLSFQKSVNLTGGLYINVIILINLLGGSLFFFILPQSFI